MPTADKARLSRNGRSGHREDAEIASATGRLIRALGKRAAQSDPDTADLLRRLDAEIAAAWATAVAGWRASGFSDTDIGAALDVSKQAVQQRWPR